MANSEDKQNKVMYDFQTEEEYVQFTSKSERLFGEGSYEEVGKHSDNPVLTCPDYFGVYQIAVNGDSDPRFTTQIFQRDSDFHRDLEVTSRREILEQFGSPPVDTTLNICTDTIGKGAAGLPQQLLEFSLQSGSWLTAAGGIYGGFRAFYDIGKYMLKIMRKHYLDNRKSDLLLNKGGVISVCSVDLQDNKNVHNGTLISAVEVQEGHRWNPSIDSRDVYCVTFSDSEGNGHLYTANSLGAILSYNKIDLAQSWRVSPVSLEE